MIEEDAELAAIRKRTMDRLLAEPPGSRPAPPRPPGTIVEVTDATLADALQTHPFVVLDCWADWCGPCHRIAPSLAELATEMHPHVTFAKLDVDRNPLTSQAFGVQSLPTLLLFQDGRLVDRVVGAVPKPQIAAAIRRHARRPGGSPGPRRVP